MKYSENAEILIERAAIPLYKKLKNNDYVNGTVELINAHINFNASGDFILNLGESRKGQYKYVENEKNWYLSQDLCIKDHPGIEDNKIWSSICTDKGLVNSNYGWCVFSPQNADGKASQYLYAIDQLKLSPNGRQSVIFYNRPQMQWEWQDGIHAKHDFTCTFQTTHYIRNNCLDYIVYMRSNDLIRGLHCGDLPWHGYVYNMMYKELKVMMPDLKKGTLYWNAGSLHVYERDYELLTKIVEEYKKRTFKEE